MFLLANFNTILDWLQQRSFLDSGSAGHMLLETINVFVMKPELSIGLLAAVAGISGVLLGLYFSAYSSAMAQLFDRMPAQLQEVIATDKGGHRYAEHLAQLTLVALGLCVLAARGHETPLMSFLAVLTATGIVLARGLGAARNAFAPFDVTHLARVIGQDIAKRSKRCTPANPRWLVQPWQNFQNAGATESLRRMWLLVNACCQQKHLSATELVNVVRVAVQLAQTYVATASKIPPDSSWFSYRRAHRSPFRSDEFSRSLGNLFGQPAGAFWARDRSWVERTISEIMHDAFKHHLDKRHYDEAASTASAFADVQVALSQYASWRNALQFESSWRSTWFSILPEAGHEAQPRTFVVLAQSMALLDQAVIIGLLRRTHTSFGGKLTVRESDASWATSPPGRIAEFGPVFSEIIYTTASERQSDALVRGSSLGQPTQLNRLLETWNFNDVQEAIERITREVLQRFQSGFNELERLSDPRAAAVWIYFSRASATRLVSLIEELRGESQRLWPEGTSPPTAEPVDYDALHARVSELRSECALRDARILGKLALLTPNEDEPNWFLEGVQHVANDSFEALLEGDDERCVELFPPYFGGTVLAVWSEQVALTSDNVQEILAPWRPFIEMIEISGLAYIHAKVNPGTALWEIVCAMWDQWLREGAQQKLDQLNSLYTLLEHPLGRQAEGLHIYEWRRRTLLCLESLGRTDEYTQGGIPMRARFEHSDPEVSSLGDEFAAFRMSGRRIFARRYLRRRCDTGDRRFGHR